MNKIVGQHITKEYTTFNPIDSSFTRNYIESSLYQNCVFNVKKIMTSLPVIKRSIFEDCIFEDLTFSSVEGNTVFRNCVFNNISFDSDPRALLQKVVIDNCKFNNSEICWIAEKSIINCQFDNCSFYEAKFNDSDLNIEFKTYGKLCSLKTPCEALVAPQYSLSFSNCKLQFKGFIKNDGNGIIKCDKEDLPKVALLLGINRTN